MFEIADSNGGEKVSGKAKIRVIGIGGGGCNAVNTMIRSGLSGVEYIVANTDAQALNASLATTKIQLGAEITKGLGAGANPDIGRKAALEEYEKISEVLEGADMVFITAGMGGGTGTGAGPVIAKLARELGALTVGVVTKPFLFEGKRRYRIAENGIESLEECVDSLISIPNQRLLYLAGENLSLVDTFKKADEVLLHAVQGISDLINNTGLINADFADVKTVMASKGIALMGTGFASGPDRAVKAATEAISSPLLEDINIDGATGIIINITGSDNLTTHETNEAVTLIMEAADDDAEIIFGTVIDENLEDHIKITVIATGLGHSRMVKMNKEARAEELKSGENPSLRKPDAPLKNEENYLQASHGDRVRKFEQDHYIDSNLRPTFTKSTESQKIDEEKVQSASAPSGLASSIREAATSFDHSRKNDEINSARDPRGFDGSADTAQEKNGRARSIAEKLGFISFDEDEFDVPSYIKKEKKQEEKKPAPEFSKRFDLR